MSMTMASYTRRSSDSIFSTSRGVTISAISMRGGASRMSIPDGSRHSTSARSDSAIRSVGRSRIDGASTGTLSSDAQVAELEAAVDEHGPLVELAERRPPG